MSDPRETRWLAGGADAPPGFAELVRRDDSLGPDAAQLARMLDAVAHEVSAPALTHAYREVTQPPAAHARSSTGLATSKLLASTVALVLALGAAWLVTRSRQAPLQTRPAPSVAPAGITVSAAPSSQAVDVAPAQPMRPATGPLAEPAPVHAKQTNLVRRPRAAAAGTNATVDPAAELQMLEQAQRAMHDDARAALTLTDEHRRRFAHPQFEQEREMLAIEAQLLLGRRAAAERRARDFERRYPHSSHRPRLRNLLAAAR